MEKQQAVFEYLDKFGIAYSVSEHPPVYTVEDMEELGLGKIGSIVKNLFLRDGKGKRHFLVIMKQEKKVNLKELQSKIGCSNLRFASEERLDKYLGLGKGAVSPFGILNDSERHVEVILDNDLDTHRPLGVHPNDNRATVWIGREDLENIIKKQENLLTCLTV